MPYTADIIAELKVLSHYKADSIQEGIKVHKTADTETIAATQRLFEKGLISQPDGGYLTGLGVSTAEHVQQVLQVLQVD